MKLAGLRADTLKHFRDPLSEDFHEVQVEEFLEIDSVQLSQQKLYITSNLATADLIQAFIRHPVSHVVQKNDYFFRTLIDMGARLAQDPHQYFSSSGEFLLTHPKRSIKLEFSGAEQKDRLMHQCEEFLADLPSSSVRESARAVIEELYMNAVLSAPREAKRKNFRRSDFAPGLVARMYLAVHQDLLVVSCSDPFGALDRPKVLNRMLEVYREGAGEVINLDKEGGAGLGCVILYEHASNLIFGSIPEKITVVSALIPLGLNMKQRSTIAKGLHFLQPPE